MKFEFGLLAIAAALTIFNIERGAQADGAAGFPRLGVYDPHQLLNSDKQIGIEHTFIYWQAFDPAHYRVFAQNAAKRGRDVMVTVEPWTRAPNWKDGRETLLSDVVEGRFDQEIASICREIGATGASVMISWGHEMDETEGRYPWANHDPERYQKAYRHFVDQCRPHAPSGRFGWTPKGELGLRAYYPGDAYVDFVGLALFDVQAWNRDQSDSRSLETKFDGLYRQVAGFGKPVVLAEFGVEGTDDYRRQSLSCIQERLRAFPHVQALVYFNARETWRWPDPYGHPEWRTTSGRLFACERKQAGSSIMNHLEGD